MKKFLFFITLSLFASAVFSPIKITLSNASTKWLCDFCDAPFNTFLLAEDHTFICSKNTLDDFDCSYLEPESFGLFDQTINSNTPQKTIDHAYSPEPEDPNPPAAPQSFHSGYPALPVATLVAVAAQAAPPEPTARANSIAGSKRPRKKKKTAPSIRRITTGALNRKPFACRFCVYRTTGQALLDTHERIHTGEKPYKCQYCDHRASLKGSITIHERVHIGEKFKCKYCDYKAAEKRRVTWHEEDAHKTDEQS
jgi:uncharacterized Zn-finger protein